MTLADHSLNNDHRLDAGRLANVDWRTDEEGNVTVTFALSEFEAFLETLNTAQIVIRDGGDNLPYLLKFSPMYLLNGKAGIKIETTEVEIAEGALHEPEPLRGQAADDVIAALAPTPEPQPE